MESSPGPVLVGLDASCAHRCPQRELGEFGQNNRPSALHVASIGLQNVAKRELCDIHEIFFMKWQQFMRSPALGPGRPGARATDTGDMQPDAAAADEPELLGVLASWLTGRPPAAPERLRPAVVLPYRSDGEQGIDFIVRCESVAGVPHIAEPDRCDDLGWWDVGALPERTAPYIPLALAMLERGEWFAEFGGF